MKSPNEDYPDQVAQVAPFQGLSEKELKSLYQLSKIRRLEDGEVLIREGESDQIVYVILEGEIEVVKDIGGRNERIAILREGDWVGEIAFTKQTRRTASALARRPTRVIGISKTALNSLELKAQLFIIRRLNDLANERIGQLAQRERELTVRTERLVDYIHNAKDRDKTDYSQSAIIQSIIRRIPRLPTHTAKIVTEVVNDRLSPREIADHVKGNPKLAAQIVDAANSPHYAVGQKVADVQNAILLLGANEIYQMIVADGLRQIMPDTLAYQTLFTRSLVVSHIAFAISQASMVCRPAEMATIGLLHGLGRAVVQMLIEKNPNLAVLIDNLDHPQLGALLLKEWGLPVVLSQAVEYQAYPEFAPPSRIPEYVRNHAAILFLAQTTYHLFRGRDASDLSLTFLDDYVALLGWGSAPVTETVDKRIVPELSKKLTTYPVSVRQLVEKYDSARPGRP